MTNYVVATIKPWNIEAYKRHSAALPGNWHLITEKDDLNEETLSKLNPRYIFFPHWSWIVPQNIVKKYECVCFHMTDVPYGRGGSPLQNLIARGHKTTKLTALRMVVELDAGPVYLKTDLDLSGSAQQIYERSGEKDWDLIKHIVANEPQPQPQSGEPTLFERRTPDMSRLPENATLEGLYDHIRMLDAETYPHAFAEWGDFVMEFTNAELSGDTLNAKISIRKR